MEIIIPTNDGLNIAPDFENAASLRILTVINGIVRNDSISGFKELLGGRLHSTGYAGDPLFKPTVLVRGILPETENTLENKEYEVFHTGETNIINALVNYLNLIALKESNYCCCP